MPNPYAQQLAAVLNQKKQQVAPLQVQMQQNPMQLQQRADQFAQLANQASQSPTTAGIAANALGSFLSGRQQNQADSLKQQQQQQLAQAIQSGDQGQLMSTLANSSDPQYQQLALAQALKGPSERKITTDINGRQRYLDTGELVFAGVEKEPEALTPYQQEQLKRDDRKFEFEQKKYQTQESRAAKEFDLQTRKLEAEIASGGRKPADMFKETRDLRKEYTDLSKDFIKQRDAYGRIQASADNPSAAGDLALIFNYMKLLDPGSVVREGEFATAQNAAGVPDRIVNVYNRVLSGERLGTGQRQDFVGRAGKLYGQAASTHQDRSQRFGNIANSFGLDPELVTSAVSPGNFQQQPQGGGPEYRPTL